MIAWAFAGVALLLAVALATYVWQYRKSHPLTTEQVRDAVQDARRHSRETARGTNAGLEAEQLAPWIDGFPYSPRDAQFFGKPVDFVVFDGLSEGELRRVVFVEVKSSMKPALNDNQKQVRAAIEEQRVAFETISITRTPGEPQPQVRTIQRRREISDFTVLPTPRRIDPQDDATT